MKEMEETHSRIGRDICITLALSVVSVLIGEIFLYLDMLEVDIIMVYMFNVLLTARMTRGYFYGIAASVLSVVTLNYFFVPPYHSFTVYNPGYTLTFVIMMITSVLVSALTSQAIESKNEAAKRQKDTWITYQVSTSLITSESVNQLVDRVKENMKTKLGCGVCLIRIDENGEPDPESVASNLEIPVEEVKAALPEDVANGEIRGDFQVRWGKKFVCWPIRGKNTLYGYMAIPLKEASKMNHADYALIRTIMETTGLVMERFINQKTESRIRQEASNERFRSDLLRSISHDLRTPLAGLMGTADLLMNSLEEGSEAYELASSIQKESNWLFDLVQNILSMTKLQNTGFKPVTQIEVVEDIVNEAIESVELRYPKRKIQFTAPPEVLVAKVDPKLIQQVVINLLDNASKHTPYGKNIYVDLYTDQDQICIKVRDEGKGIPKESLEKIFQLFYTTHGQEPSQTKGFGLGLPICSSIMKAHGGSIQAGNNPDGKGAYFMITMPAASLNI